jgi:predicted NBD/HSP70 family sugar kinase
MSTLYYGIDLGGSSLKAVCVDETGKVLRSGIVAAGGYMARDDLTAATRRAVKLVALDAPFARIGLAFGGAIQPNGSMLPTSTNLPNIANVPLISFFEEELGALVRIENDARAAMRGEAWSGAARGLRNAMTITFGTGIGSGIMLNGMIMSGSHGTAGEIGEWVLGDDAITFENACAPGRVERATGQRFDAAFVQGQAANMLSKTGRAIANAHLLLDLEAVVLLGGITELGEPLREAIEAAFGVACPADYRADVAIKLGEHGALAGAVGAASLWRGSA